MNMVKEKLKVFTTFAGYGTDNFALKQLGIDFECVGFSEIDKYAIQCFVQNHSKGVIWKNSNGTIIENGEGIPKNYGDILKIDWNDVPDFDLLTGGFCCQPYSVAGKNLGLEDLRGQVIYGVFKAVEAKKPKYILLENVKGLTNKTHKPVFDMILNELDKLGYNVYWRVLNTKDYGIPQNRERVFFVCIRKDIDKIYFSFPEKEELKISLKDILERDVDKKYYLSEKRIEGLNRHNIRHMGRGNGFIFKPKTDSEFSNSLSTKEGSRPTDTYILQNAFKENPIFFESPTLTTKSGDNYIIHSLFPRSGNPCDGGTGHLCKEDNTSYCVDTGNSQAIEIKQGEIRRLTPKEAFRLQGFLNDEVDLKDLSCTQCYKLAGNGQSVNVVRKIFEQMLEDYLPNKSIK